MVRVKISMIIQYLGHSSFRIKTNNATIITDPFESSTGLRFPKQEADIVTISHSHPGHNHKAGVKNENCFFIENPGEYEVKEVMIRGFRTYHDGEQGVLKGANTVYLIQAEGLTICHLGDLAHEPSEKLFKELESANVLMISASGKYPSFDIAKKIIHKIEPSIVLPMHYKTAQHSPTYNDNASLDEFINKLNLSISQEEKLNIKDVSLPEEMVVYQLEIKG